METSIFSLYLIKYFDGTEIKTELSYLQASFGRGIAVIKSIELIKEIKPNKTLQTKPTSK